jgi:cytochrome b6-f complex iron-sulfur subunit
MNRKNFLKACAGLTCAGTLLPLWLQSCKGVTYVPYTIQNESMAVKKADLAERPFVLVKAANLPAPVYLARLENGEYSALLLQCTHKACELSPSGKELHCPCHGSVFSNRGEVLESPAERPLRRFTVSSDNDFIYIR